jgi:cytochrome c biogenesis protein CcdA/thiol-disulfide isomerase/thioredoxin
MLLLVLFAFIAGVVTILSPCILPVLPLLLSSTVDTSGKRRPIGVVTGFIASFTFFTLFLSSIVRVSGVSANFLRFFSISVLVIFGATLMIPTFQGLIERLFARFSGLVPNTQKQTGFLGGFIIGLSLGLLWTPCVGPILASVISLALTGSVTAQAVVITFAYALGTGLPMFVIMQAGTTALQKVPWLTRNTPHIQRAFGALMVLTAIGVFFNLDRRFQTFVLNVFPQYGVGLTNIENNEKVREQLRQVSDKPANNTVVGRPMSELTAPRGIKAPEIIAGGQWFNSTPLRLSDLRGKVVVVDFWTYSCINCQRTLPYLKSWWEKYKDQGLVIIGVHAPEFEFEKDAKNVGAAINEFGLKYPIVQDNNFATWRAYDNLYWPAKYFIDKDGYVRFTHFGEGAYDESERMIQQLLAETGADVSKTEVSNPAYQIYSRTPETYLGYERMNSFASNEDVHRDTPFVYSSPATIPDDTFSYFGEWMIASEYAAPSKGAKLFLNFESKEVYLVARPKKGIGKMKVFVDDKVQFLGEDNKAGVVTVDSDRLYKLINLPQAGRHVLRLEFDEANIEVFAFTFG